MNVGETLRPSPGEKITCLRSGQGGGPFEFELELGPGVGGPPMHSHDEGDEIVEVLEGAIEFHVGGLWRRLDVGESLTLRPEDVHTFRNPSRTEPVRCKVIHGARFERVIEQPGLFEMCIYATDVDPGASRVASPFMAATMKVIAWIGKLRGLQAVVATAPR